MFYGSGCLALLFEYFTERILDYLNSKLWSNKLPEELEGIYDAEKYKKSQEYTRTNTRFSRLPS